MTASDIMRNMIDGHSDDCTCDSCQCIDPKCQDDGDECKEVRQPSEGRKKMKTKLIPVMANCAMLLLLIGLGQNSVLASRVPEPIEISSAIQIRIFDDIDATINGIGDIDDIRNINDIDEIHDINNIDNISAIKDIEIDVDIEKAIEN